VLDASGRIGQFFLADGNIKIRLDDRDGQTILAADNLLVIGPSAGGGGVASIDATTVLTTGDMKIVYGTGALTGFVRCNGRTIGSATSGASERANADAQALFLYLYGVDTNLTVSTGRGASAAADWSANKTIALPDWRGRSIAGLSDMGNSDNGILANTVTTLGPTVLGGSGGLERNNITVAQGNLPNVNFTVATTVTGSYSGTISGFASDAGNLLIEGWDGAFTAGTGAPALTSHAANVTCTTNVILSNQFLALSGTSTGSITGTGSGTAASGGSGTALVVPTLQPTRLTTIYIKL